MQVEIPLPAHSAISDLVPYNFPLIDQSRASHVDAPDKFVVAKYQRLASSSAKRQVALGENSLAISRAAVCLRKAVAVMELDYKLRLMEDEASAWLDEELFSAIYSDVDNLWQINIQKLSSLESEQTQLSYELHATFEAEPLEDGIKHSAEQIIERALQSSEGQQIFDWFENFSLDTERPSLAASILRCLGRQGNLGTSSWRAGLVRKGLAVDNVEIRDAAVQATESWGDPYLADILRSHNETEPWLHQYILDVINDLGE